MLSDGEQTTGDVTRAAAAARARDVTVDAVPLVDSARRDAALIRVDAPATVHQGDTISLLVTVRSTAAAQAALSVALDGGKPASQVVRLRRGENPFTLSYTAAGAGWHSFRARVALANDERAQNDALTASVQVGAPPRVIVASATPEPPIAAILSARGVRATRRRSRLAAARRSGVRGRGRGRARRRSGQPARREPGRRARRRRAGRRPRPAHARRAPCLLARRVRAQRARPPAPGRESQSRRSPAPPPRGRARAGSLRQHGRHRRRRGHSQDDDGEERGATDRGVRLLARRRVRHRRLRQRAAAGPRDAARDAGRVDEARARDASAA